MAMTMLVFLVCIGMAMLALGIVAVLAIGDAVEFVKPGVVGPIKGRKAELTVFDDVCDGCEGCTCDEDEYNAR